MEWIVKHGFRQDTLYRMANVKTAAIRKKSGSYIITDSLSNVLYRLEKETPLKIKIYGVDEGYAEINLSKTNSLITPPRAESLNLVFANTLLTIVQTQKRDFIISKSDCEIGRITGILRQSTSLEIADTFQADIVAVFYALALFMLHEDDIDIV